MDYCYSTNEEEFNYDSEWECLDSLFADDCLEEGFIIYRGVSQKNNPSAYFRMDRLVEDMQERAWEESGEWSENFLDDVPEKKWKQLEKYISNWLDKNASVNFFTVENVEKIIVTQDMVDEFNKDYYEGVAMCRWNSEADICNQWDNLSEDEQKELIEKEIG